MAFGPRPGDREAFEALGPDDDSRLAAYVEEQLSPGSIDDSELETRMVAAGYSTLEKPLPQLWRDHVLDPANHNVRSQPAREIARALFLRAVYSRRQLSEVLAEFWHAHFNVYAWDGRISSVWTHYDRDVIRGHMLGNFREMIGAVSASPAMLYYLDNYTNSNSGPNENFARELFELHTMGAENYLGIARQHEVPRDGDGIPIGYVDGDVYEATRCFTGWTIQEGTGELDHRSDWHDRFQKNVLGSFIPPDQAPLRDGEDVLDLLAAHPGTARHISRKLCRRFISDRPPQRIVLEAAEVFQANIDSPDQLTRVVRTILLSPEFRSHWGRKIKRPFEVVASCMRACDADILMSLDDRFSRSLSWQFELTRHAPFAWRTPDGYPDTKDEWLGTGILVRAWRLINWLFRETVEDVYPLGVVDQTPPEMGSANSLADYWIDRMLGRPMAPSDRSEIVEFMAQGRDPDVDLRLDSDSDARHRVRSMVALIAMSPDFLLR